MRQCHDPRRPGPVSDAEEMTTWDLPTPKDLGEAVWVAEAAATASAAQTRGGIMRAVCRFSTIGSILAGSIYFLPELVRLGRARRGQGAHRSHGLRPFRR